MPEQKMKPNDKVGYIPHIDYALHADAKRDYPWLMGWKGGLPTQKEGRRPPLDIVQHRQQVAENLRKHREEMRKKEEELLKRREELRKQAEERAKTGVPVRPQPGKPTVTPSGSKVRPITDTRGMRPQPQEVAKNTARPEQMIQTAPDTEPEEPQMQILDTSKKIRQVLAFLKKHPRGHELKKNCLVFIKPVQVWDAKVRSVNENGTVNLDVKSNIGGVTLHFDNVEVDHEKQKPHTCHKLEVENA